MTQEQAVYTFSPLVVGYNTLEVLLRALLKCVGSSISIYETTLGCKTFVFFFFLW